MGVGTRGKGQEWGSIRRQKIGAVRLPVRIIEAAHLGQPLKIYCMLWKTDCTSSSSSSASITSFTSASCSSVSSL